MAEHTLVTVSVIDLGLREPAGPDEPATHRPRPRRRLDRRRVRRIAVVLAAIALPALLLGAAIPGRAALVFTGLVRVTPDTRFAVVRHGLLTATTDVVTRRTDVALYAPDGGRRWRVTVPGKDAVLFPTATTVTVMANDDGGTGAMFAYDATTGRPLWRGASGAIEVTTSTDTSDRMLVHRIVPSGDELDWLDARTGRAIWTWNAPAGAAVGSLPVPPGADAYAVTQTGDLYAVRADDSDDVSVRHLAGLGPVASPVFRYVSGDASVVLVIDSDVTRSRVSAFDPGSYAPRWSVSSPGGRFAQPCGAMICEGTTVALEFYDPRDGSLGWSAPPSFARSWGSYLVIQQYTVIGPGRAAIVDPHTGRPALRPDPWTMLDITADGTMLFMAPLATTGQWIGTLRPGQTSIRALAPVPDITDDCGAYGRVFACRTFDDQIKVLEAAG